ncbi:MAG: transcription antitermination factor NusB [Patescibacteria group bacterium]|jgi:N utilization substance protein B
MQNLSDSRHEARKLALAAIFCWLFSESDERESLAMTKDLVAGNEADEELTKSLVAGVKANKREIDDNIEKYAPEWPIDKISKIDLVILRIAVYELLFAEGIPEKVAIDEAVELAKEFGNENSSKFVNGVLGSILEKKENA